jgi:hypothetical protein
LDEDEMSKLVSSVMGMEDGGSDAKTKASMDAMMEAFREFDVDGSTSLDMQVRAKLVNSATQSANPSFA